MIVRARPDLDAPLIEALVGAYEDDPVMNYAFRAGPARHAAWAEYFRTNLERYRGFGGAFACREGRGAALWAPPGRWHVGLGEQLRLLPRIVRMLGVGRLRRGLGVMQRMQALHPEEPHWYLNLMGVHPREQSRGIGAALLRAGLERAERDGLGAYLESSNERNLTLYRRHGFETRHEITVGGGVRMWLMWREARR